MARTLVNAGAQESHSGARVELEWSRSWNGAKTKADLDPFLGFGARVALNSHYCNSNP